MAASSWVCEAIFTVTNCVVKVKNNYLRDAFYNNHQS